MVLLDPDRHRDLDRVLAEIPMRLVFAGGGPHLAATGDSAVHRALGRVVDAIRQGGEDGTWARLKVCARDSCRWAFYDASRNQARRWCSMATGGNSVKIRRAYRARRASLAGHHHPEDQVDQDLRAGQQAGQDEQQTDQSG
jgi:predicted RNA-binding Zn ribbon-like protein